MRRSLNSFKFMSLKLSVTGDTAKYLVLTLCRGGALFPQDSVNLFCHDAHFAQMAKWRLRRDLSEVLPRTTRGTRPTYIPLLLLVTLGWVHTTYLIKTEPIWLVVALEASRLECLQSLCFWVAVHKWDTHGRHRDGSGVTTQHKSILPISTQVFH